MAKIVKELQSQAAKIDKIVGEGRKSQNRHLQSLANAEAVRDQSMPAKLEKEGLIEQPRLLVNQEPQPSQRQDEEGKSCIEEEQQEQ